MGDQLNYGTIYIGDHIFKGLDVTDLDCSDYDDIVKDYVKKNFVWGYDGEIVGTMRVSAIQLLKLIKIWSWVSENCHNPRVKHLMEYGKTSRVRLKNFRRGIHLIASRIMEVDNEH